MVTSISSEAMSVLQMSMTNDNHTLGPVLLNHVFSTSQQTIIIVPSPMSPGKYAISPTTREITPLTGLGHNSTEYYLHRLHHTQ